MSELPVRVWKSIAESRQARIDELEAALPLLVASPSLKERASIARRALEADR